MSGMNRMAISLGLVFLIQKLDWEDPSILWIARVAYYSIHILLAASFWYAQQQIEKKADKRAIWIKPTAGAGGIGSLLGFGGAAGATAGPEVAYQKTTYYKHESEKAGAALQQALMGMAVMSFFHFKMHMHLPMAMQIVMGPMNAMKDPLIMKYVLGSKTENVWDESLTEPIPENAESNTSNVIAESEDESVRQPTEAERDMEEAIVRTWESKEPAEIGTFEALVEAKRPPAGLKYRTQQEGWTALMVVAGGAQNNAAMIKRLVELGADPLQTDADGWTALHWAVFQNAPEGVRGLCESVHGDNLHSLLLAVSKDGKSAGDLAAEPNCKEAREVLLTYIENCKLSAAKTLEESRKQLSENENQSQDDENKPSVDELD